MSTSPSFPLASWLSQECLDAAAPALGPWPAVEEAGAGGGAGTRQPWHSPLVSHTVHITLCHPQQPHHHLEHVSLAVDTQPAFCCSGNNLCRIPRSAGLAKGFSPWSVVGGPLHWYWTRWLCVVSMLLIPPTPRQGTFSLLLTRRVRNFEPPGP